VAPPDLPTGLPQPAPSAAPHAEQGARPSPARALLPRTVLVACSEPQLGDAVERVLRHHGEELAPTGVEVRRAHDGLSCLRQVELARPDLLVVSAQLDRMSAEDILRAWDVAHPSEALPAIVLSAGHGRDVPKGMSGAAVLRLPFDNEELVGLVGRALAS
jgi:DNA-binding response OmpR family regulator